MQVIKDNFLQLLVNLLRFSQNDIPLTLNRRWLELGVLENIGKDVDGGGYIGVESLCVVDGVFTLDIMLASISSSGRSQPTDVYAFKCPPMFSISNSNCCCVRLLVP
jgi:hypothetical protein